MRHPSVTPRRRAQFALLAASSLVSLLAGEAAVRMVAPQPRLFREPALYFRDGERGYRHKPGYVGVLGNTVEYTTRVAINQLGLRGPEVRSTSEPRVLIVGDSFTFGQGVEQADTFASRTESLMAAHHPVQVLNAGIAGEGPGLEAIRLAELGPVVKPDVVVAAFYLGNDLENDRSPVTAPLEPDATSDGWFTVMSRPLYAHSHLYRAVRSGFQRVSGHTAQSRAMLLQLNYGAAPMDDYAETAKALDHMVQTTQALHATLVAVLLPDVMQVVPERQRSFHEFQSAHEDWHLDLATPNRVFATLLGERQVPVLDLTPAFQAASAQGRSLYWSMDGHWNANGHALAAELIAGYLESHLSR